MLAGMTTLTTRHDEWWLACELVDKNTPDTIEYISKTGGNDEAASEFSRKVSTIIKEWGPLVTLLNL